MAEPIDLLLITRNREQYLAKSLPPLFQSAYPFRLYMWDNGSGEATRTILSECRDERIVKKEFSSENAGQGTPFRWFLQRAEADLVGKVDDDILVPKDWLERIAPVARGHEKAGALACWIFPIEDWKKLDRCPNYVALGRAKILRWPTVQGHTFLVRRELCSKYVPPQDAAYGLPLNQLQMTLDGYYSGYPLPPVFAHNMDDPRSPHLAYKDQNDPNAALTWRYWKFSRDEYAAWIARDAVARQFIDYRVELRMSDINRTAKRSLRQRMELAVLRALRKRQLRAADR